MTAVFLDLDGTLMDSRPGIVASIAHAFRSTGNAHHAEDDLTWMIGPSFLESFAKLEIADPPGAVRGCGLHIRAQHHGAGAA